MSQISQKDAEKLSKRIVAHHPFPGASHIAIQRVLAKGDYTKLPHGAILCAEGEPGDDIFFLVTGNISVTRKDTKGEDRVLSDMTCPCVFGHMAVIDGSRRSATCRASGPVEVVTLHRSQVDQLLTEGSVAGVELRRLLIASLCDQLSSANGFVREIVLKHATPSPDTPAPAPARANQTQNPLAQRKRPKSKPSVREDELNTLAAKLGGWAPGELDTLQDEIEIVMDEDQRRTRTARRDS